LADDAKLRSYCSGLQSNWLRKDTRLNGGVKYVAKNPGSRAGSTDPKALADAIRATNITDNEAIGGGIQFNAKGQNDKVGTGANQNRAGKNLVLTPKSAANAKPEWPMTPYPNRA